MTADVIIPVYRPDARLKECLRRLEAQTVKATKIILMNTEECYFDPSVMDGISHIEVHHLTKEQFDHGKTRHEATAWSQADILIFMTQDALPKDRYLIEHLIRPIEEGKASISYGRQLAAPDCRELERYTRQFNYPPESCYKTAADLPRLGIKTFFCSDVCAAYLRKAGNLLKSGKTVAYAADARVIHSHNYTGLMQFHRNFDLAVSQADHPEIFAGIRSETEGIRLVKETARHFLKEGKPWILVELVWKSGWKFLGYRLGKQYRRLPGWMIRMCTMSPSYWEKQ